MAEEQKLHLREYWQMLKRRRWLLILPVVIIPLTALLATYFMTPIYQASTTVLINEASVLPPTVARNLETAPRGYPDRDNIRTTISNQIRSTAFLRRLITKLDLKVPEAIRRVAEEELRNTPDVSAAEMAEHMFIQALRERVSVQVQGTNLVSISTTSNSPVMAKRMAEALADIYLEENLAHDLAGVQGSISFTEEQLSLYRDKLYAAEDRIRNFRQGLITTAEDTTSLAANLRALLSAIQGIDIDLATADQEKADLRASLYANGIDPASFSYPSSATSLKNNLMATVPRLGEMLTRYDWRDNKVVTLNQEAIDLLSKIDEEIKAATAAKYPNQPKTIQADISRYQVLDIRIDFLTAKRTALEKGMGRLKAQLARDPDIEVTLDRLQSEVTRYRDLYNLFVQHAQFAAIDQSAKKIEAQSKYVIVQPAALPLSPVSPNRFRILLLGLFIGVALGGGVIILLEMMDDSFKTVEQVSETLHMTVLATIPQVRTPYMKSSRDRGIVIVGAAISLVLLIAIIFMKFGNG